MVNLHNTISLLEQALKDISPNDNRARDVRLHIVRAINEARHLAKKEARTAQSNQMTAWDQWRHTLDLEMGRLTSPYEQKLAVNILDSMIGDEQKKLEDLADRKKPNDNVFKPLGQQDVGTLLG